MEEGKGSAGALWRAHGFALYFSGKHLNLEFSLGSQLNQRGARLVFSLLSWNYKHICFWGLYRKMFPCYCSHVFNASLGQTGVVGVVFGLVLVPPV